jgi:hypothetical protein
MKLRPLHRQQRITPYAELVDPAKSRAGGGGTEAAGKTSRQEIRRSQTRFRKFASDLLVF